MASVRQPLRRALSAFESSAYVCKSCKNKLHDPPIPLQRRGYASKQDIPFTEKVRRKIWGTDNPPGLADPYGGPSFLEKRRMRREAAQQRISDTHGPVHQETEISQADNEPVDGELLQREPREYVEARTWDGLQHIGHLGNWRDLPPEPQDQYYSWANSTSKPALDRPDLLSCLHQSIVECLTCRDAAIDPALTLLFNSSDMDTELYASTVISASDNGLQLHFASDVEKDHLTGLLSAVGEAVVDPSVDAYNVEVEPHQDQVQNRIEDAESTALEENELEGEANDLTLPILEIQVSHYAVSDEGFLTSSLDLHDPLTFTILKRFAQLSGRRIPDQLLNSVVTRGQNLQHLLDLLHDYIKPKPKDLAAILVQKQALTGQSNVWVMPRRETPVDKEKEVGRWKVIEKELQDRGLPVLGTLQS